MIHNVQPGPLLFANNPLEVNTMIATVLVANIVMGLFMFSFAGQLAKLMYVPHSILLPVILACCVVGSFALNNRGFRRRGDVWFLESSDLSCNDGKSHWHRL